MYLISYRGFNKKQRNNRSKIFAGPTSEEAATTAKDAGNGGPIWVNKRASTTRGIN